MSDVLDVDLLAFETGAANARSAVVDGVMRSLGSGFVFVGHDIPLDLLDTAYGLLAAFFSLPAERKERWRAPESHGQTGYTGLLVETAAVSDVPDWKEMLNWGAPLPPHHPLRVRYPHRYIDPVLPEDDVPGIRKALDDLHARVLDVQARFLRVVATGVGVDAAYFDDLLRDGTHLTRAIHYPSMTAAPTSAHVWADAHTDINLVTGLPRATTRGLQLLGHDGWVDVVPPEGHMIVNSGMMLERLTNGRIPAGLHRVVATDDDVGDRYSVVQFCHPAPWFQLAPVPSCVDDAHPLRYGTIEAGALLDRVLYEIGLITDDPPPPTPDAP
jgi:isopenicillin N synthase-like dioxygenase